MTKTQLSKRLMNYKLPIIILVMGFVLFPFSNAYSEKIYCSEDIDLKEYPICNYVTEWNESEEWNEKVVAELSKQADKINDDPNEFYKIYQKIVNQINKDNPGLQEKCQNIKNWIYDMI